MNLKEEIKLGFKNFKEDHNEIIKLIDDLIIEINDYNNSREPDNQNMIFDKWDKLKDNWNMLKNKMLIQLGLMK